MSACSICCEDFSLRRRKPIVCVHCKFVCCIACYRQYILSSITEPACMSCKVQHSYDFLLEHLPTTFWHREYKDFRKNVLLSREESLLPDTQDTVVKIHKRDNFHKFIESYRQKINRMQRKLSSMYHHWTQMNQTILQEMEGPTTESDLFDHFDDHYQPLLNEKQEPLGMMAAKNPERRRAVATDRSTWMHACPREECRGLIRGNSRCPICLAEACSECLQEKTGEDHTCVKEDVETATMLRQNTKSCPNCSVAIFKISGCDQMWCTQCRTPFSWKTGLKINQTIHNPHFYDWIKSGGRETARNPMDIPCGGLPTLRQLDNVFLRKHRDWVYSAHRTILHVEQVVIPRSQAQRDMNENEKNLRVQYLMNRISKNSWKDELYRREKVRQKHNQYLQIMQTFVAVASDWMRRMVIEHPIDLEPGIAEMNRFFHYIHTQIRKMNLRFKSNLQGLPEGLFAAIQKTGIGEQVEEAKAIEG